VLALNGQSRARQARARLKSAPDHPRGRFSHPHFECFTRKAQDSFS